MVRLVPMTGADFERYMATAIDEYAEDRFKCGDCTREEALERSRDGYAKLLPEGFSTPCQHLYRLHADGMEGAVGMAWIAMPGRDGPHSAYLYDFAIDAAHRRKGLGTAALQAVEAMAQSMGARQIALNVMGWNLGARSLYEKAGFGLTGIGMNKNLG